MSTRFKGGSFNPHFIPEKLIDPLKGKQGGRRIGVCFTGDLFGDWVDPDKRLEGIRWIKEFESYSHYKNGTLKELVYEVIESCPTDTFVFLTKRPEYIWKWGKFPDNAWVGVTACNDAMLTNAVVGLSYIDAPVKFLSIEPLMNWGMSQDDLIFTLKHYKINWIVIGGWSTGKIQPKIEWIKEIVGAADKVGIPIFLKDNLINVINPVENASWLLNYRQEFPNVKVMAK
jgi:hypothetical protein